MSVQGINNSILIKGKSRNWMYINDDKAVVESGDYLWVSKSIPKSLTYYTTILLLIASLITSIATLILITFQLRK